VSTGAETGFVHTQASGRHDILTFAEDPATAGLKGGVADDLADPGEERLLGQLLLDRLGLANLQGMNELTQLELGACPKIGDEALANLKGLPKLNTLELDLTSITDKGLVHLEELKDLGSVNVKGTLARLDESAQPWDASFSEKCLSAS